MGSSPIPESTRDYESGYGSASSSESCIAQVYLTKPQLAFINSQLHNLEPAEVINWATITFPSLYQETAFGLTGLCTLDMLSKIQRRGRSPVEIIFLDTLHHFIETYDLVERIRAHYPGIRIHVYKPASVNSAEQFAAKHGDKIWESNDRLYDWVAKVEPAQRAYRELGVSAVLTGRRRSQGGARGAIPVIEVDETGLIKINPFANWKFGDVEQYIRTNKVPYNTLVDQGYKSIGDWHSTKPVLNGGDERSGRWQGQAKTECGIHNPRSHYAQYLRQQAVKA